ncbi:hypothetical protein V8C37DRAFT_251226 [Trichoderma ceciliae]
MDCSSFSPMTREKHRQGHGRLKPARHEPPFESTDPADKRPPNAVSRDCLATKSVPSQLSWSRLPHRRTISMRLRFSSSQTHAPYSVLRTEHWVCRNCGSRADEAKDRGARENVRAIVMHTIRGLKQVRAAGISIWTSEPRLRAYDGILAREWKLVQGRRRDNKARLAAMRSRRVAWLTDLLFHLSSSEEESTGAFQPRGSCKVHILSLLRRLFRNYLELTVWANSTEHLVCLGWGIAATFTAFSNFFPNPPPPLVFKKRKRKKRKKEEKKNRDKVRGPNPLNPLCTRHSAKH